MFEGCIIKLVAEVLSEGVSQALINDLHSAEAKVHDQIVA